MITPKRTSAHLPKGGILSAAFAVCLLATLPLAAQDRSHSRPSSSGDSGRSAHESHGSYAPPSSSSPSSPPSSSSGDSGWRSEPRGSSRGDYNGPKPRTAVPVEPGSPDAGGGPNRQPPSRHDNGRGGHNSHGGHYGGGGYYPGYGYGYYPYGSFWWNVFWGYPYYYDWEYPRYRYGTDYHDEDFGALDLDVSPARTQVWLDGQYIGTVDDFDGWPRYLWLERGTYDLVLYLDGYKTNARQVSIYPGLVIDIDDQMEPGESVKPQDLETKVHERRDARRSYESERQEELDRRRRSNDDDEDEWRSRSRRHRVVIERDEASGDDDGRDGAVSEKDGNGTVKLSIEPDDASVYLDGKFIGTGADLAKMASGMPVEAGSHELSVVRPGRKDENVSFKVKAGAEVEVEVELEEKGGS